MDFRYFAPALALILAVGTYFFQWQMLRTPAPSAPVTMTAILTKHNAGSPVVLKIDDRRLAVAQCIAAFETQESDGIRHFGNPSDVDNALAEFARESCDCLIVGLEKRTTTFEFVLAMAMQFAFAPRTDYAQFSAGSPKKRELVLAQAKSIGISTREFDAAGVRAEEAILEAGDSCMDAKGR